MRFRITRISRSRYYSNNQEQATASDTMHLETGGSGNNGVVLQNRKIMKEKVIRSLVPSQTRLFTSGSHYVLSRLLCSVAIIVIL